MQQKQPKKRIFKKKNFIILASFTHYILRKNINFHAICRKNPAKNGLKKHRKLEQLLLFYGI